jgi:hypothetical protein
MCYDRNHHSYCGDTMIKDDMILAIGAIVTGASAGIIVCGALLMFGVQP